MCPLQIAVSTAERVVNLYSVYFTDLLESLVDLPDAAMSLAYCPRPQRNGNKTEALVMGDKLG